MEGGNTTFVDLLVAVSDGYGLDLSLAFALVELFVIVVAVMYGSVLIPI